MIHYIFLFCVGLVILIFLLNIDSNNDSSDRSSSNYMNSEQDQDNVDKDDIKLKDDTDNLSGNYSPIDLTENPNTENSNLTQPLPIIEGRILNKSYNYTRDNQLQCWITIAQADGTQYNLSKYILKSDTSTQTIYDELKEGDLVRISYKVNEKHKRKYYNIKNIEKLM